MACLTHNCFWKWIWIIFFFPPVDKNKPNVLHTMSCFPENICKWDSKVYSVSELLDPEDRLIATFWALILLKQKPRH